MITEAHRCEQLVQGYCAWMWVKTSLANLTLFQLCHHTASCM